jgi:hypothetical protein
MIGVSGRQDKPTRPQSDALRSTAYELRQIADDGGETYNRLAEGSPEWESSGAMHAKAPTVDASVYR